MSPVMAVTCIPVMAALVTVSLSPLAGGSDSCVCLKTVLNNTAQPIAMEQQKGGEKRIFVADQKGTVHSYLPDWTDRRTLVDISSKVVYQDSLADERGLLGFALHPNFTSNKKFYMYSVRIFQNEQYSYVTEMRENGNGVDVDAEKRLLVIKQPHELRNGGQVRRRL